MPLRKKKKENIFFPLSEHSEIMVQNPPMAKRVKKTGLNFATPFDVNKCLKSPIKLLMCASYSDSTSDISTMIYVYIHLRKPYWDKLFFKFLATSVVNRAVTM